LVRLRAEAQCRVRMFEEMIRISEREMDELDVQIQARKSVEG